MAKKACGPKKAMKKGGKKMPPMREAANQMVALMGKK